MKTTAKNSPLVPSWGGVYPADNFPHVFAIGLGGLARCGKTTVGTEVIASLKKDPRSPLVIRGSFSTRIKQIVATLTDHQLDFNDQDEKDARLYGGSQWTVRDFLMAFGTGLVREQLGADFWVDVVASQLANIQKPTIVVFDDMRFPNEVQLIKSLGVATIIERPGVGREFVHPSEKPESLGLKTTIKNDSTPQAAAAKVIALAKTNSRWSRLNLAS